MANETIKKDETLTETLDSKTAQGRGVASTDLLCQEHKLTIISVVGCVKCIEKIPKEIREIKMLAIATGNLNKRNAKALYNQEA